MAVGLFAKLSTGVPQISTTGKWTGLLRAPRHCNSSDNNHAIAALAVDVMPALLVGGKCQSRSAR